MKHENTCWHIFYLDTNNEYSKIKIFFRLVKFLDKYLIKQKPLYQKENFVKMSNVLYLVWKAGKLFTFILNKRHHS